MPKPKNLPTRNLDTIKVGHTCLTDCNEEERVKWLNKQTKTTLVEVASQLANLVREFGDVFDVEG